MAPAQVTKKDEDLIWVRLSGQAVRVSRVKGAFDKGYLPNWTEQHYRLEGTSAGDRRVYKHQNIRREPLDGTS